MTSNSAEIRKSIDKSLHEGTPIPIDHLHYADPKSFTEHEIMKRRAIRKERRECQKEQ